MENSDPKRAATPVNASNAARPPGAAPASGKPVSGRPDSGAPRRGSGTTSTTGKPWLLRKRGSVDVLRCQDLATLRTWMIERRVSRDDEISRAGKVFRRIGNIVEFESLFHSAEVERAERRRGQRATNSGMMAVPSLTGPNAARSEGSGRRSDVSVPPQLRVTPPGLTPAAGNMNPLRLTPSGQPSRPRPPVPAVPILQIPDTPTPTPPAPPIPPAAAASSPPSSRPAPPPPAERAPPAGQGKPAAPSPAAARQVVPTAPSSVAANKPASPPVAPPSSAPAKAAAPPLPSRASESERPIAEEDSGTDPTRRFVRVDMAADPAERGRATKPTPPPVSDTSKSSGNDTVAFHRADPADLGGDSDAASADGDETLINPPSAQAPRAVAPATKSVDPVEEALRLSDPVPRHLKETTDPNRTSRIPSLDTTERLEGGESRRGLVLLLISLGLAGLLILGLRSAGTTDPTNAGTRGAGTGSGEPDHGTAGTGANSVGKPDAPKGEPGQGSDTNPVGTTIPATPSSGTTTTPGPDSVAKPQAPPDKPLDVKAPPTAGTPSVAPPVARPTEAAPSSKPVGAEKTVPPTAPTPASTATTPNAGTPPTAAAKPATQGNGKKIVVTEFPKTFDEQMDLAQRLVEHEQFDEAQRLFEAIMSYASHVPAVHVGLGKCALETGRLDAAIEHYNNALGKATNYGPAIFGLAKTYRAKGDKERALQQYRRYLELYPSGGAAGVARDSIARLEGTAPAPAPKPAAAPSSSELVKPPSQAVGGSSELVKPQ